MGIATVTMLIWEEEKQLDLGAYLVKRQVGKDYKGKTIYPNHQLIINININERVDMYKNSKNSIINT